MATFKYYDGTKYNRITGGLVPKTTKTTSDTETYSCNYVNNEVDKLLPENSKTTGTTNTYSCDYINSLDEKILDIYSTSEQIIGTWLGKPLYRKVIEYTFLEANIANAVTTIPNLEYFTKIEGFFVEGFNRFLVPYSYNNEGINCYTSNNTLYEVHNYSFPNNKTAFITIEYTKTTD